MLNYTLANPSYVKEYLSTIVKPNTIGERVFKIIETLVKDRNLFRINTVISLIPENERNLAKDFFLQLIQQKLIVPVKGEFEKHLIVEEKKVTRLIFYPVSKACDTKK